MGVIVIIGCHIAHVDRRIGLQCGCEPNIMAAGVLGGGTAGGPFILSPATLQDGWGGGGGCQFLF